MDNIASLRQDGKFKILIALFSLYFIWGSTYLAIKIALEGFPPFMMAGIRFILTGCGLYFFLRARGTPAPRLSEWTGGSIVGGLLLLGGNGGVVYAEQTVSSGLAALGVAAVPLWTVLFAGIWKRWPGRLEWAGIFTGFAGVALLNLDGELRASPAGAVALVIATLCWAFGSAWSRHLPMPQGFLSGAVQMISGGVFLLIASLFCSERIEALPSLRSTGALVYLMVFGSLVAFSAYVFLLKNVRPALATSYAYMNPVIAVLLGAWLAGERMTGIGIGAMAIIISGVVLVGLGQRNK
ncbi:MAG: drug/metabolite exporter YedA [Nitrospirota bacterium]